jgi:hypothetical protein
MKIFVTEKLVKGGKSLKMPSFGFNEKFQNS